MNELRSNPHPPNQEPKPSPIIEINNLEKYYGAHQVLEPIQFAINQGEFFTIVGPSGCGKTTLLRVIAGFEEPSSGTLIIDGQNMAGVTGNLRPTNMVFQSYAIFPHMTVGENVAYGLEARKVAKSVIKQEVNKALAMVGLEGLNSRPSSALSGGQKQRVALARALILKPKVLLLDEPLSALDKKMREQMQYELRQLQRSVGITFVLVTHDQEEALTMSDRIAVMDIGNIAQLDTPEILYNRPVSRYVANFVGTMNFLDFKIIDELNDGLELEVESLGRVKVDWDQIPRKYGPNSVIGMRPERFTVLSDKHTPQSRTTRGTIVNNQYFGDMTYYDVMLEGSSKELTISMRNSDMNVQFTIGDQVDVGWDAASLLVLDE